MLYTALDSGLRERLSRVGRLSHVQSRLLDSVLRGRLDSILRGLLDSVLRGLLNGALYRRFSDMRSLLSTRSGKYGDKHIR